jgi:hypothetical protein
MDVHVWKVDNPTLRVQFDRQKQSLRTLDCWKDVSTLDAENNVRDVCQRGFRVAEGGGGLSFQTGEVNVAGARSEQHQYLLCRVAVGRAYALVEEGGAESGVPKGYDSLYRVREAGGGEEDGGLHYAHEYVVFNPAQVLPEYVVHFTFRPEDAVALGASAAPSEVPLADRRRLFRTKLQQVKSEVTRALSVLGPSLGDATEAMLGRLSEEYETALHASAQPDPLLEGRKRSILDALRRIESAPACADHGGFWRSLSARHVRAIR